MSADREILAEIHLSYPDSPEQKINCLCTRIFLKWVKNKEKSFFFLSVNFHVFFFFFLEIRLPSTRQHSAQRMEPAKRMTFSMRRLN